MRPVGLIPVCALELTLLLVEIPVSLPQGNSGADVNPISLLNYLNTAIGWYRDVEGQRLLVTDTDEAALAADNQQIANQVVLLAFEFARREAESIEKAEAAIQDDSGSSRYQALRQMLARLDQQVRANQTELESLRQEMTGAVGRQRDLVQTRIAETRSQLELAQVRRDSVRSMAEFVAGSSAGGLGATGIRERIEALARSIPAAMAPSTAKQPGAAVETQPPPAVGPAKTAPASGLWALSWNVYALSGHIKAVQTSLLLTDSLGQQSRALLAPLVSTLKELSKRGDELAGVTDVADDVVLVQQKAMLDALTAQFKRTSSSVLPLSKQGVLLEAYQRNLENWQAALNAKYASQLKTVLFRASVLVLLVAAIFGGAELWRRAIFRYVRDARRRYQYLLMRKIVFWSVIGAVFVVSFATELSSVATFAGLITAGVAVALQNVIVSVVAYFFLIGKFGIRVGDRVQVAGTTGEVVDIGLVRFHVLELATGGEKTATGRVVGFSNSIVFQANAGFFKQIPGTSFVWHEITLTVAPDGDYRAAEERLRVVVEDVFTEYRDEMEKQYRHMERTLSTVPPGTLRPTSRLRLAPSGLDVVIRYPVDLLHASEIDDRVTRELLTAIEREPALKVVGSGKPPLRLKTDVNG